MEDRIERAILNIFKEKVIYYKSWYTPSVRAPNWL